MPAGSQRAQAVANYFWTPDAKGSVDLWFSTSLYMPQEWDLNQVNTSSSQFLSLVSFRSDAANGSMNVDGHKGHLWLRRNTIFKWPDGLGTDMIDLGPITKGKWMNLTFHIKFSTTNVGAVREVWRDGTFMGRKTEREHGCWHAPVPGRRLPGHRRHAESHAVRRPSAHRHQPRLRRRRADRSPRTDVDGDVDADTHPDNDDPHLHDINHLHPVHHHNDVADGHPEPDLDQRDRGTLVRRFVQRRRQRG